MSVTSFCCFLIYRSTDSVRMKKLPAKFGENRDKLFFSREKKKTGEEKTLNLGIK